ncbi:hypothetical protein [Streptomyces sp. SID5910]|uniref:hypothetical protein n=1 Tax=Streptomyces sp. SID5910 TaxID=2690312 RepID=UPI00136BC0AF|nr:hypothetical protein [Streptomyces sp. SID5910]MYR42390.1 hypothetical protein [Streptomyces sp. SID5910]
MKRSHLCGVLAIAALLASGCSSDKPGYDYSIPSRMCGVDVDKSAVKPLLPPGKEGKATEVGANDWKHHTCWVVVDKKRELAVSVARDSAVDDASKYGEEEYKNFRKTSLNEPVTSAGIGDDGAVAWMKCRPKPGQPQEEMPDFPYTHLVLKIHTAAEIDHRADLERFLRSYIPNLTEAWCT